MQSIGLINNFLNKKFGFKIKIINNVKYEPKKYLWFEREKFEELFEEIKLYTLVDKERCYVIYQFLQNAIELKGEVAEVGVYKGGTAKLIATTAALKSRTVHLFDTFLGLPKTNSKKDSYWKEGEFSDTSFYTVKEYLSELPNAILYKGIFPETANPIKEKNFCFVHIDVDIYQSALDCCKFFYSRMQKGGIMIFDDYGFVGSEGLKKAVDEFAVKNNIYPIYLPTGQGLIIKSNN